MKPVNRKQKAVLVALAAAIAVVQFMIFDEDGIRGYGWVLAFGVIAGVLFVLFRDNLLSTAASISSSPQSDNNGFNDLIFELGRVFREAVPVPPAEDTTSKVIQRDAIYGAVSPLAYGLLALKHTAVDPDYFRRSAHGELLALVTRRMAASRSQIAGGMTSAFKLPGLEVSANVEGITSKVLEELQRVLRAIADGARPRPLITAQANLLSVFVESAPFVAVAEHRENLRRAIGAFIAGYLRHNAL
jgi:hypothetical protein